MAVATEAETLSGVAKNSRNRQNKPKSGGVNRELLVVFLVFAVSAVLNLVFSSQRMVLGLYLFPTIYAAYHYGRRHAVLTACLSAFLVVLMTVVNPALPQSPYGWS